MGSTIGEHELVGRCLSLRSTLGQKFYRDLLQFGPTIKDYAQANGDPEYFMIEQPGALFMFTFLYPERDSAVYFRDPGTLRATFGEIITESPMPRVLLGRMSDADQAIALQVNPSEVQRPLYGRWREAHFTSGGRSRGSYSGRRLD